ncbi:MAG: tetratricopeptide repeat protein [Anaeromyxobacter sp.]|nr:tetratricopeptide repeat protein [Anaeromyxobacter sp.]MBL0275948.1 tetratricopeptide repeat protein [Anaeromyxobacter sp.]
MTTPTTPPPWPLRALDALASRPRLVVLLAAVLPFLGTLQNPPILDDGWAALDNPLTWSLRNVGRIFRELYGFAGEPSVRGPYRPLTTLSYALDYAVHGRWTPGYHLVNVALHGLASLLVLAVARRLAAAAWPQEAGGPGRAARVALLAGLLFAVHPAHVEAVASIFGRTEPLSTSFALGALLLALGRRGAAWRLPAALLVLVAGVLSKEVAIVTPGIFLVIAVALPAAAGFEVRPGLRGAAPRRALAEAAAVAGLLATALVPYLLARGPVLGVAPEARWFPVGTPAAHVALTMSRVLGEYLRILAFPAFLGGDFAYAARLPTLTGPTAGFALATAAWLATLAAGLLLLRRAPLAAAGLLWIFLPLLPVLQVIPVGVLLAERLLYLPSVGFCLAVAAALGGWLGRGPAAARAAAAGLALVAALAGRTVARTLDWRTAVAYWEAELATAPREVVVNNNLAVAYLARGRFAEAVERLRVVLEVHPRYWRAHINMGLALQSLGDKAAARRALEAALPLAPESTDPPFYLARFLGQEGDRPEALRLLAGARRLRPEQARLPLLEGELLLELGRVEEGRTALREAARLDPGDQRARQLLERTGGP